MSDDDTSAATPTEETRWFEVETTDWTAAHAALDDAMTREGYLRASGDNYDTPGVVRALGWRDDDGDGEVG
jgi:hypothetical protein